jgi:hypothetical protein
MAQGAVIIWQNVVLRQVEPLSAGLFAKKYVHLHFCMPSVLILAFSLQSLTRTWLLDESTNSTQTAETNGGRHLSKHMSSPKLDCGSRRKLCMLRGNIIGAYSFRPPLALLLGCLLPQSRTLSKMEHEQSNGKFLPKALRQGVGKSLRGYQRPRSYCHSDVMPEFSYLAVSRSETALVHRCTLEHSSLQ